MNSNKHRRCRRAIRYELLERRTLLAITALDDFYSVPSSQTSDLLILHNDIGDGIEFVEAQSPDHGVVESRREIISDDLRPRGEVAELIFSEVVPGDFIELFNTAHTEVHLNTAEQLVESQFTSELLSNLAPGVSIGPRQFGRIPWPTTFASDADGGEIILFKNAQSGLGNPNNIDDFVAWGTNRGGSRLDLARSANKWQGGPLPAPSQGSIQRIENSISGDPDSYAISELPTPGHARISDQKTYDIVRYIPPSGFVGDDQFQYVVRSIDEGTATATVNLVVETSPSPWKNAHNATDVNADGRVQPLDVLQLINEINSGGTRSFSQVLASPILPPPFLDTDGNGELQPLDVVLVVNDINRTASPGEGEASNPSLVARWWSETLPKSTGQESTNRFKQDTPSVENVLAQIIADEPYEVFDNGTTIKRTESPPRAVSHLTSKSNADDDESIIHTFREQLKQIHSLESNH